MSYCEVYWISSGGRVYHHDDAKNSWGGAMHIWSVLHEKYLLTPFPMSSVSQKFWSLTKSPSLTEEERVCLAITYDGAWIAKKDIPELIRCLEVFWEQHHTITGYDGKVHEVHPTIPSICTHLRDILVQHKRVKGVCFNHTSVNSNPWKGINVSHPKEGQRAWNVFEALAEWRNRDRDHVNP